MGRIKAVPVSLKQAQEYVDDYHRHHMHTVGDKYRVGAEVDGELVGIAQVGRPVARHLDDGKTLEVLRLCTRGEKDVCSFLYSRCARIAREMGYTKIITYILDTENGASLRASGWHLEKADAGGSPWDHPSRPRDMSNTQMSLFPEKQREKYPVGVKQRWAKDLEQ